MFTSARRLSTYSEYSIYHKSPCCEKSAIKSPDMLSNNDEKVAVPKVGNDIAPEAVDQKTVRWYCTIPQFELTFFNNWMMVPQIM